MQFEPKLKLSGIILNTLYLQVLGTVKTTNLFLQ